MRGEEEGASPLSSLEATAARLAGPLPADRIAAIAAAAAADALRARIVALAVDARVLHVLGVPPHVRSRLTPDSSALPETIARWAPSADALSVPIPPHHGTIVAARDRRFSATDSAYLRVLAGLCGLAVERQRLLAERARLRALARHHQADSHVRLGDIDIDLCGQDVLVGERRASLTPSELRLLLFLAEEPGLPRTRRDILRHLWHTDHVGDERACDAHIANLRRKIERDPSRPERVVTMRGVGYALRV